MKPARTNASVENPGHNGEERPRLGGYIWAILVAAFAHAGLIAFAVFIAPGWLRSEDQTPPSYTVKIVDTLPAGDLGTHLPRLDAPKPHERERAEEVKPEEPTPPPPKIAPPDNDKEAIALNTRRLESPTPTPTPEPTPEPERAKPTPRPTNTPRKHRATPKPTPTPSAKAREKAREKQKQEERLAKENADREVKERLAKLKEQLLAQHLKQQTRKSEEVADLGVKPLKPGLSGGGPVAAGTASEGTGYGVGAGTGSAGIQQDLDFLLYYRTVQEKIKKAWSFTGGSNDLTATVDFSIANDGTLTSVKIATSSNDPTFDESVLRAIRAAAPFPPPPAKYRSEFNQGIEALFKLGELKAQS
jgi:periplasmic protein TonB